MTNPDETADPDLIWSTTNDMTSSVRNAIGLLVGGCTGANNIEQSETIEELRNKKNILEQVDLSANIFNSSDAGAKSKQQRPTHRRSSTPPSRNSNVQQLNQKKMQRIYKFTPADNAPDEDDSVDSEATERTSNTYKGSVTDEEEDNLSSATEKTSNTVKSSTRDLTPKTSYDSDIDDDFLEGCDPPEGFYGASCPTDEEEDDKKTEARQLKPRKVILVRGQSTSTEVTEMVSNISATKALGGALASDVARLDSQNDSFEGCSDSCSNIVQEDEALSDEEDSEEYVHATDEEENIKLIVSKSSSASNDDEQSSPGRLGIAKMELGGDDGTMEIVEADQNDYSPDMFPKLTREDEKEEEEADPIICTDVYDSNETNRSPSQTTVDNDETQPSKDNTGKDTSVSEVGTEATQPLLIHNFSTRPSAYSRSVSTVVNVGRISVDDCDERLKPKQAPNSCEDEEAVQDTSVDCMVELDMLVASCSRDDGDDDESVSQELADELLIQESQQLIREGVKLLKKSEVVVPLTNDDELKEKNTGDLKQNSPFMRCPPNDPSSQENDAESKSSGNECSKEAGEDVPLRARDVSDGSDRENDLIWEITSDTSNCLACVAAEEEQNRPSITEIEEKDHDAEGASTATVGPELDTQDVQDGLFQKSSIGSEKEHASEVRQVIAATLVQELAIGDEECEFQDCYQSIQSEEESDAKEEEFTVEKPTIKFFEEMDDGFVQFKVPESEDSMNGAESEKGSFVSYEESDLGEDGVEEKQLYQWLAVSAEHEKVDEYSFSESIVENETSPSDVYNNTTMSVVEEFRVPSENPSEGCAPGDGMKENKETLTGTESKPADNFPGGAWIDEIKETVQHADDAFIITSIVGKATQSEYSEQIGTRATSPVPFSYVDYTDPSKLESYFETRLLRAVEIANAASEKPSFSDRNAKSLRRSSDLVPLAKQYQDFRKRLRTLVKSTKEYQKVTQQLELVRLKCYEDCNNLFEKKGGDGSSTAFPSVDAVDKRNFGSIPLMASRRLSSQDVEEKKRANEFQYWVLDYVTKWEKDVTSKIDADLKDVKKLQQSRLHYEKKVDGLRQKLLGLESKNKEIPPTLTDKVNRNEMKLRDAWETHEHRAGLLCIMIEQVTDLGWVDLYPLVENLMKWEYNRSGKENVVYGQYVPRK